MYQHLLIIGSDFSESTRIAMHFSYIDRLSQDQETKIKKIKESTKHNDLDIVIHSIETNDSSTNSVIESDPYFKGIIFFDSVTLFLEKLLKTQKIIAKDVAEYILSSLGECSHLKLQKLLYFSFEEYLIKTGKTLFPEDIIAYTYGPVVEEVYREYRSYGRKPIKYQEKGSDEQKKYELIDEFGNRIPKSVSSAKFISVDDGLRMIEVIDNVLEKYGDLSPWKLVEKSHEVGSPWYLVYEDKPQYGVITPNMILKVNANKKGSTNSGVGGP